MTSWPAPASTESAAIASDDASGDASTATRSAPPAVRRGQTSGSGGAKLATHARAYAEARPAATSARPSDGAARASRRNASWAPGTAARRAASSKAASSDAATAGVADALAPCSTRLTSRSSGTFAGIDASASKNASCPAWPAVRSSAVAIMRARGRRDEPRVGRTASANARQSVVGSSSAAEVSKRSVRAGGLSGSSASATSMAVLAAAASPEARHASV